MGLSEEKALWSANQHRPGPRGAEFLLDVFSFTNSTLVSVDDFDPRPHHRGPETHQMKRVLEDGNISLDQAWSFVQQYVERFVTTRFNDGCYDLSKGFTAAYEYFLDQCLDIWMERALTQRQMTYSRAAYEKKLDKVRYHREGLARVARELLDKHQIAETNPLVTQLRGCTKPWKPLDNFHNSVPEPFASEYLKFALNPLSRTSDEDVLREFEEKQARWNGHGENRLKLFWAAYREAFGEEGDDGEDDESSALQQYKEKCLFQEEFLDMYTTLVAEGTHIFHSEAYMKRMGIPATYFVQPSGNPPPSDPFISQLLIEVYMGDESYEVAYLRPIVKRIAARKILRFIIARFGNVGNLHHHMNRPHGPLAKREYERAMAGAGAPTGMKEKRRKFTKD